jgi:sugar phosphate isomerase/epimerase
MTKSRREFLIQSGAALTAAAVVTGNPFRLNADPLGHPVGIQLYTVKDELAKDYDGTLAKVAAAGYKEVELAGFFDKKPAEIKASLDKAGLHCGSVHIPAPDKAAEAMEYAKGIGAKYVVSSVLLPKRFTQAPGKVDWDAVVVMLKSMTLEDYKGVSEQCNELGQQAKTMGLQFAYHNHNIEFKPFPGGIGYDVLLNSTDPELVKFELDCGWMSSAGFKPATYIAKYPDRYRMLHIKDFKLTSKPSYGMWPPESPEPTELGRGTIDYKPIFAAAKKAGKIDWYYVEQEPPYNDMPVLEAIKVDYEYLHKMS